MTHPLIREPRAAITDDWLSKIGFKWHRMERQPFRHWVLWLGDVMRDNNTSREDLGIELSATGWPNHHGDMINGGAYHCWLRADTAGRYGRFIHIRHLTTHGELLDMIHGLTGAHFDPDHAWYGALLTPEAAARRKRDHDRMDIRLAREEYAWSPSKADATKGGPLPEHMEVADAALAKAKGEVK